MDKRMHVVSSENRNRVQLKADTPPELSSEWKTKIEKRCREVDDGTAALIDADEVFKKAYAR